MSPRPAVPPEERFFPRVDQSDGGCWLWTGDLDGRGYGTFWVGTGTANGFCKAHRWAYEFFVGPIPEGLTLDHLCRVRNCVNPDHLEPVTQGENVLRGDNFAARNARKTHCIHGHEFTFENTYSALGRRSCRACGRERKRKQAEARKNRASNQEEAQS